MLVAKEGQTVRGLMLIVDAAVGDVEKVEGSLRDGVNPNVADSGGWTPLHLAAALGRLEVVRLLLRRGADPTVRNELGHTPLHAAVMQGRSGVARVLLEHGGARLLEIPSDSGRTPLDCVGIWPLPGDGTTHRSTDPLRSATPPGRPSSRGSRTLLRVS